MQRITRRRFLGYTATAGVALVGGGLLASCQRQPGVGPSVRPPARLGFLALTTAEDYAPHITAFRAGLRDLGYNIGANLEIEERFAQGREDLLPELASELS